MFGSNPPDLHLIFVQPADDLITFVHRLLVFLLADLPVQLLFLQGGPNVERLRLQTILHGFLISLLVILSLDTSASWTVRSISSLLKRPPGFISKLIHYEIQQTS